MMLFAADTPTKLKLFHLTGTKQRNVTERNQMHIIQVVAVANVVLLWQK